jgi:hypothetical protein
LGKGVFSCLPIEEMQFVITNARADVWVSKKQGVVFPTYRKVKAAIHRHPVMDFGNVMDACHPDQNGIAQYQQTRWTGIGMCTPTPKPMSSLPGMPPSNNCCAHLSDMDGVAAWYVYLYTWLPNSKFYNHDAYAMDCNCEQKCIPDFLTYKGTTPG